MLGSFASQFMRNYKGTFGFLRLVAPSQIAFSLNSYNKHKGKLHCIAHEMVVPDSLRCYTSQLLDIDNVNYLT